MPKKNLSVSGSRTSRASAPVRYRDVLLTPEVVAAIKALADEAVAAAKSSISANDAYLHAEVRQLRRQVSVQDHQLQELRARTQRLVVESPLVGKAPGRAARALESLRGRLADQTPIVADVSGTARRRWVADGIVVPTSDLSLAWGVSRQALDQARQRGDLVGLKVANRFHYPAAFLALASDDVARLCRALVDLDPVSHVIFWSRKHGALDNRTVAEALDKEGVEIVVRFAEAFADDAAGVALTPERPAAKAHAA